jgi:hypothetical protein
VYYVLVVEMIVFGGEKFVGIESRDGFPWRKGPSADGEGLGPVLDAGRRGVVLLGDGDQVGEFLIVSRSKEVLSPSNVNSLATGTRLLFA